MKGNCVWPLVVLIPLAVALGGCSRSGKSGLDDEERPAYRSYSDERYGFEFQYPGDWAHRRDERVEEGQSAWVVVVGPEDILGQPLGVVFLLRSELEKGQDAKGFLDTKLKDFSELAEVSDFRILSEGTMKLAGRECPQATCEFKEHGASRKVREVAIPYEGAVLNFRLIGDEDDFRKHEKTFNDILDSVKFAISG